MTRNRTGTSFLALAAAGLVAAAAVAAAPAPASAQSGAEIDYETYTLDNGLRVILAEDHSTPAVAVDVWYHVGSRHDPENRSGFAHLFEHMMFQGSQHVGHTEDTEHLVMVEKVGGNANGTTGDDRTNYFQTVPANRVNMALWLEADRMRFLEITQDKFENQRDVVKEERRQNVDNQPYGLAFRKSLILPYDEEKCFGYSRMGIGSMEDLNSASLDDVQAFYDRHYAPNNAVLTVAGDFDPETVKELIERYFAGAEASDVPPDRGCEADYDAGFRIDTIMDPNANLPAVTWTFRTPPHDHEDDPALTFLTTLLGQGESSRLHRALVRDAGAASNVNTFYQDREGPGLVFSFALANEGVSPDSLRSLFWQEIERLREEPPTAEELEKAKNSFESDQVTGRQSVLEKAETLQHFALYHDDLSEVNTALEDYMSVTSDDLQRVIDRYLTRDNLTVIVDIPSEDGDDGGEESQS
ncbi:MAG: M16 family metallopeptidase [Gemmatimonadota bacterium]